MEQKERLLGVSHPSTLKLAQNLGHIKFLRGDFGEAEALYSGAIAGREIVFGRNAVDTLVTLVMLAELYVETRRPQKAHELLVRAIEGLRLLCIVCQFWAYISHHAAFIALGFFIDHSTKKLSCWLFFLFFVIPF